MRKKIIIIILMILASVTLFGLICKDALTQELVQLEDGRIIAVDACWTLGDQFFCETEVGFQVYARHQVRGMTKGLPTDLAQIHMRLAYMTGGWFHWEMDSRQRLAFAQGILTVVVAFLVLWGAGLLIRAQRRWRLSAGRRRLSAAAPDRNPVPAGNPCPGLAGFYDVEKHFLEIFRYQIGADPQSRTVVELLQPNSGKRGGLYRLAVFTGNEWCERRMTISPLGEGTRSKSQCFYVIYDTHLVVKIPPLPISDFSDYRHRLAQEASVARQLGQRPCIIPNLAALLTRVHPFDAPEHDAQRLEARYLQWLLADPSRQRFFKVAGAFAFFMDVSRYQFMSDVLAHLADATARWGEVIAEDVESIDSPQRFEEKYGEANGPLGFRIQALFAAFDHEWRLKADTPQNGPAVSELQKKEWLLTRLAGLNLAADHTLSAGLTAAADRLLKDLVDQQRPLGIGYRHLVEAEAQKRTFRQARPRMAGLVANLLDLLAWLGDRRVAMRDLKPDNLFVAGDPKQYPHFLSSPERFAIGLIDVETAVVYPADAQARCGQPQLGGTPPYATPSQFFPNTLLQAVGGDLLRILHFQDWYAVVGIVFEVIAGRRLFAHTAKLIPRLILAIREKGCRGESGEALFRRFSRQFWSTARSELDRRSNRHAARLESVLVNLPDGLREELKAHLENGQTALTRQIEAMIDAQDPVIDAGCRKTLIYDDMEGLRHIMSGCQDPDSPDAECVLSLCFALVPLKQAWEEGERMIEALSRKPALITAKALLPLMFDIVQTVMDPVDAAAAGDALETSQTLPEDGQEDDTLGFTHSLGPSVLA